MLIPLLRNEPEAVTAPGGNWTAQRKGMHMAAKKKAKKKVAKKTKGRAKKK